MGGADIFNQFLKANLIDEIRLLITKNKIYEGTKLNISNLNLKLYKKKILKIGIFKI